MNKLIPYRIKLGLIFSHNEQWIGGSYYILNLISALKSLPFEKQPKIIILSNNENDFRIAQETDYPFLEFRNPFIFKRNFVEKIIDKIHKIVFRKYVIDKRVSKKDVNVIFPANNDYAYQKINNKIYWFADFQHILLPHFFSKEEIVDRNNFLHFISKSTNDLVLSSESAKNDWDGLSIEKKCKVHIIPFAVTHTKLDGIKIQNLLNEFNLSSKYFIVSNQFWVHKNHFLVLKAAAILKKQNFKFQIIFTGKENDYRNEGYFKTIISFVEENNLSSNLKFLGLLDREKQLVLMKNALAVIQPSLFEGWSTVVEDAKSLGCKVFASDIPVHREQLKDNANFFDPNNENQLIHLIKTATDDTLKENNNSYYISVKDFGLSFYELINNVCLSRF